MRLIVRCVLSAVLVAFVSVAAFPQGGRNRGAARPGTGDVTEHFVVWKYLEPGVEPDKEPLVVEWLPASQREMEHSPLLDAERLTDFAGQCIGLQVVLPDDKARIDKLGLASERPIVLLVDGEGKVLRRVRNERGTIRVAAVEQMVQSELDARGDAIVKQLNEAKSKAVEEKQTAIEIYKKVWDQRCLFPFAGHEAQRELRTLGVIVGQPEPKKETPQQPVPPALKPAHEHPPH